ncbi:S-type pyocin domain-containing protein [Pseudomonas sp. Eth.TT006]
MQNPPKPPDTSRPGFLQIDTALEIKGVAPDHMRPGPRTSNDNRAGPFGHGVSTYYQNLQTIRTTTTALELDYQNRLGQLPHTIEAELAGVRSEGPTHPLPPVQSIVRELGVVHTLSQRKAYEFHSKTVAAHEFYGGDPFNRHVNEFMTKATTVEKWPGPNGIAMQALQRSLHAANDARVAAQVLQYLNQRTAELQNTLAVLQAAEQSRLAEEAHQAALENARVAAEQHRQRAIADAARREQEQINAQEQVRLAEAAAQQVAEQTRLKEMAERQRLLEVERSRIDQHIRQQAEKTRLEQQQKTQQKARRAALRQARLKAQAQAEARWHKPLFANAGSAAYGPAFSGTLGNISTTPASAQVLKASLRTAVSIALTSLSTAAVGFAALLVPSELGNGDLFSASVPLSELAPELDTDLYEVAATDGEVDVPVRLGTRTKGNRVEIVVARTNGVTVTSNVPVRLAQFDVQKNVYTSVANADSKGPIVTWTPLTDPLPASTGFPVFDTGLPIYPGADITPSSGRIDPFPELDLYGFGGYITIFPSESGIPPIFTVFRDRRQDPGVASGTGQAVSGHWLGAASTPAGAPIPAQIADKLRGRRFSNFRAFRKAFWKAIGKDQTLYEQFSEVSKKDLRDGLAPRAPASEQIGLRKKLEIHHIVPINKGGEVYDISNLTVLTPKQHIELHSNTGGI